MGVYRRTLAYYQPFIGTTVCALLLSLVGVGLNLLKPWPIKYLVDGVLAPPGPGDANPSLTTLLAIFPGSDATALILILAGAMVAIEILGGITGLAANQLFVKVGLQSLLKLRTELYSYLQSLSLRFHDTRRTTDSSFRVAYDSQAVQTIYNKGFSGVFTSVLTLVGTFVFMLRMDWLLTLVSLLILPAVAFAIRFYAVRIRDHSTTIQESESNVLTAAQEGLSAIRMVHAFAREDHEVSQFSSAAKQSMEASLRFNAVSLRSALIISILMAAGTALVYFIGGTHVLNAKLSLGELLVFAAYVAMLYAPLQALIYTAWAMQGASAGAQRCFEVLDREDDVKDAPDAIALPAVQGAIRFEKVVFGYDERRRILDGIDLEVPVGQTLAVVGGTGAGKSTLLSLVPRFYDPDAGRILVDGHDLKSVTKRSLRNQIGIVLQDTLLFSTTIRENIAYGRPDATEEDIVEAARRAQAHDFIMATPDGYRSQVGERGGHLSVGQRQRIGIARAFLKNAPILLLDEPTSALDPATENAIMGTFAELMKGRTTIIITHRISTIHHMDRIVVLDKGRIAEVGTGPELLAADGVYANLYKSGHYNE